VANGRRPTGVLVGGSGLIGGTLLHHFESVDPSRFALLAPNSKELSLRVPDDVRAYFERVKPDFVVNCAIAAIDSDPQLTFEVDCMGTVYLARAAREIGIVYGVHDHKIQGFHRLLFSLVDRSMPVLFTGRESVHSYTNAGKLPAFVAHVLELREAVSGETEHFVDPDPEASVFTKLPELIRYYVQRWERLNLIDPTSRAAGAAEDPGALFRSDPERLLPAVFDALERPLLQQCSLEPPALPQRDRHPRGPGSARSRTQQRPAPAPSTEARNRS